MRAQDTIHIYTCASSSQESERGAPEKALNRDSPIKNTSCSPHAVASRYLVFYIIYHIHIIYNIYNIYIYHKIIYTHIIYYLYNLYNLYNLLCIIQNILYRLYIHCIHQLFIIPCCRIPRGRGGVAHSCPSPPTPCRRDSSAWRGRRRAGMRKKALGGEYWNTGKTLGI